MKVRIVSFSDFILVIQIQGIKEFIRFEVSNTSSFKFCNSNIGSALAMLAFPFATIKGLDLEIPAPVNPELKLSLELLSVYWHQNRKNIFKRPIIIKSDGFSEQVSIDSSISGSLIAFSGGVDSTYALSSFTKSTEIVDMLKPTSAIMINGFGYSLEHQEQFDRQFLLNKEYCQKKCIDLFSVKTNWKEVAPAYQLFHIVGIVGVMNLFAEQFKAGVIGLDFTLNEEIKLGVWGNTALISRLLSNSSFPIFPAGGDRNRIEKLEYLFNNNEYKHLAVCNNTAKSQSNCGCCEKCIRTKLMLLASGVEISDNMFDDTNVYRYLPRIKITKKTQVIFYESLLALDSNINEGMKRLIVQKLQSYDKSNIY